MVARLRPSSSGISRWFLGTTGVVLAGLQPVRAQQADLIDPFRAEATTVVAPDSGDADLNALEFCGIASILDQRSFNFTDARTKKNFWVPMNGAENGFAVESYDEQSEQVVVRHGTRTRSISLRKTVLVAMAPPANPVNRPNMPPPPITTAAAPRPPGAGVDEIKNPKTPEEVKQAEYEARMLVSDLLDISMQERARQKALRDAQARGQAAPATPPATSRR